MIAYYSVCLGLAFLNLLVTIFFNIEKKVNSMFTALTLIITISNFGYLSLALSKTVEGALFANKLCYLGGCFISPIVFLLIMRVSNYKFHGWFKYAIYGYSLIVYLFVLTTGYSNLYYTEQWLGNYYDATVLEHTYGPLYSSFLILMIGYMVVNPLVLIYSMLKNKKIAKKPLIILVVLEIVNVLLYFVNAIFFKEFEFMPATYVITGWILIFLKIKLDLYDVEDTIGEASNRTIHGYIVVDSKLRFLGANDYAKLIIPELNNCTIDYSIRDLDFLKFLYNNLIEYKRDNEKIFRYDAKDKIYTCKIETIINNGINRGFLIELRDDTDRIKYLELLNKYNENLKDEVNNKATQIVSMQNQVVLGMANIVENRDNSTGGHIKRTSDVVKILLDTIIENNIYNVDGITYNNIIRAAPMHDLGKIAIPDIVLQKPGRFTLEEYELMKTHAPKSAELVYELLGGVETPNFISIAQNIARYHHEKWNGMGYPDSLKENDIPFEARIMAVADVYDALISKRCYKDPMSFEEAYSVMIESMGSHFDPKMEKVFNLCRDKLEEYYRNNQ